MYNYILSHLIRKVSMKIEARIDLLKEKVLEDDFLKGRGLGNEIPFWIFDYPLEHELFIRTSVDRLVQTPKKNSVHVLVIDLYALCLKNLENKISYDKISEFELSKGSDKLLEKLRITLKPKNVKYSISEQIASEVNLSMVFLTGIGKAWPLIRSHSVLNNLQPIMGNIPLVAFYPGEYDNHELSLFGKFKDANYYRAFQLINDRET